MSIVRECIVATSRNMSQVLPQVQKRGANSGKVDCRSVIDARGYQKTHIFVIFSWSHYDKHCVNQS